MTTTIKIFDRTTRKYFNGVPAGGTIFARQGRDIIASCNWSGNLGWAAAFRNVLDQVSSVHGEFVAVTKDALGDEHRTLYRNGAAVDPT